MNEKIIIVTIYYKVQIYFKNHPNDYQTWWSTQSYVTYEFTIPFQFYMKSSTHVVARKTFGYNFSFKQT